MENPPHLPLAMWRDLSPDPKPLNTPTASSPRILIVGAGVVGLTTAWALLDKGYHVTILSTAWPGTTPSKRLTSQIAGALWEFPPAVCGVHTTAPALERAKPWAMTSYAIWAALADIPAIQRDSGVTMRPSTFFFPEPVADDLVHAAKMREIVRSGVRGFVHTPALIQHFAVSPAYGARDAYALTAPVINTDRALHWLLFLVHAKGACLVTETLDADLLGTEGELLQRYAAVALVNATGLGSRVLAADEGVYPVRGALLRVRNPGIEGFPRVEAALAVSAGVFRAAAGGERGTAAAARLAWAELSAETEADTEADMVFLVPRGEGVLLVGGLVQPREEALDLTVSSPTVVRMRERAEAFLPALRGAELDADPLVQGLRPFREGGVRVERERRERVGGRRSRVVHSYGHGGSGWTLSWGCAGEVVELVEAVIGDREGEWRAML